MRKAELFIGLPASGKSRYAKEIAGEILLQRKFASSAILHWSVTARNISDFHFHLDNTIHDCPDVIVIEEFPVKYISTLYNDIRKLPKKTKLIVIAESVFDKDFGLKEPLPDGYKRYFDVQHFPLT